jgi:hypothetical protein
MCRREHDQVGRSTKWFICGTSALAVDAPGVRGQVGLFPLGSGFHGSTLSFPYISFILVVARLENGGGSIHGQFDIMDGELCALHFLLCFFCGQNEVRHAHSVFIEEEHVRAQCNNVKSMLETSRVLLQVFKEVMRKDLVEERGAILEFVDVPLLHCDVYELLEPSSAVFQIL